MSKLTNTVEELVQKAGRVDKADDALKFSQAACNAANALRVLIDATRAVAEARAEALQRENARLREALELIARSGG